MALLQFIRVSGESLAPRYRDGDFVLISGLWLRRLRPGDVVVFEQPGYGLLIKQIRTIGSDGSLEVIGEGEGSVDSRIFGPVQRHTVLGRVILHFQP